MQSHSQQSQQMHQQKQSQSKSQSSQSQSQAQLQAQAAQAQAQAQAQAHAQAHAQRQHLQSQVAQSKLEARPAPLTPHERERIFAYRDKYYYSPRYSDDEYEYRHVALPRDLLKIIPSDYFCENGTFKILQEDEWRSQLGITQSLGWVHYGCHAPEPHILLFRKPKN